MSLFKQLLFSISLFMMIVFSGSFIVTLESSRHQYNNQLLAHAQDAATALGVSLTPNVNDPAMIELMVSFNQSTDIDILYQRGKLLPENWRERLANNSSPYYSTMAFLVRKGNPKNIQDWADLTNEGVSLVFPNPKTSGNARYTYLGAYGAAKQRLADDAAARDWMVEFLKRVVVFDTGGRGATTSFVERQLGDVLITFESEVNNIIKQYPDLQLERVVPKTNILAEFPVAWVDRNVSRNGTEQQAKAYLEFLYSEQAQQVLASHYYRVHHADVVAATAEQFPATALFTVEEVFGSWDKVNTEHFGSNAELDKLLGAGRR